MKKKAKMVSVVPYNPEWPQWYEDEVRLIKDALGDDCLEIHHVGSTSVPGLSAKSRIDILSVVTHPDQVINKLASIGFDFRGEFNIPMRFGFTKRGKRECNLHVFEKGHPEVELNLIFRDYLRSHPDLREAYARVKMDLVAEESSHKKGSFKLNEYTLKKGAFIRQVLRSAGFRRLRVLKCSDAEEWEAARSFRQRYFFDKVPIADPYEWTFSHEGHVHMVLYHGVEIIGYAHIQLWPQGRALIRIIVVDEAQRGRGFGRELHRWIEKWLRKEGCQELLTEAHPDAVSFYRALGFQRVSFEDPEGHARDEADTQMGKFLIAKEK